MVNHRDSHKSFEEFMKNIAKKAKEDQDDLKKIKTNATMTLSRVIRGNIDSQGDAADIRISLLLVQLARQIVMYTGGINPPKNDDQINGYKIITKSLEDAVEASRKLAVMVPVRTHFILETGIEDASAASSPRDFALSLAGDMIAIYKLRKDNYELDSKRREIMLMASVCLAEFIAMENPKPSVSLRAATFSIGLAASLLLMALEHGHIQSDEAREIARLASSKMAESSVMISAVVNAIEKNGKL